jgi:hypothetical protein
MSSARSCPIAILALALGACAGSSSPQPQAQQSVPSTSSTAASVPSTAAGAMPTDLPPLPVTPFPAARPPEIVRAVYTFAAQHPEVLSKVPCFCGCESRGHRHNDDCFVAARDGSGRVTAWEPHGVG